MIITNTCWAGGGVIMQMTVCEHIIGRAGGEVLRLMTTVFLAYQHSKCLAGGGVIMLMTVRLSYERIILCLAGGGVKLMTVRLSYEHNRVYYMLRYWRWGY